MKKTLLLICLCMLGLLIPSCGKKADEYKLLKEIPTIEPYQEFDMESIINKQDGVTYSFSGTYLNSRGAEKEITFDGSKFLVPENDTVAEIDILYNGNKEHVKISVVGQEDEIDAGMRETWCEDTISKITNYNPQYIKDGKTSLKVTFNGYFQSWGTQFICITGHLSRNDGKGCYDVNYYDIYKENDVEEAFKDAVFYFWVYNAIQPSTKYDDTSIDLGARLRTHDNVVNIDWCDRIVQTAESGEWSLYTIRLKNFGITKDFYKDLDSFYAAAVSNFEDTYDTLTLKVAGNNLQKDGTGKVDTTIKQNFTFYVDGFNLVSYKQFCEKFPDVDIDSQKMGQEWQSDAIGTYDNWYYSGEGISFDFKLDGETKENHVCSLINVVPGAWNRVSEYITFNFDEVTASKGKLTKGQNGVYHYELMFADLDFNLGDGPTFVPDGHETVNMIYFKEYPTSLIVSNIKVITNYSI